MQTMLPGLALGEAPMDVQAFQAFYQENLGPIYRYVYHQVSNREEAEDLTSEIFLKAVSSIDPERSLRSMQDLLYLIALTMIADYCRVHFFFFNDTATTEIYTLSYTTFVDQLAAMS